MSVGFVRDFEGVLMSDIVDFDLLFYVICHYVVGDFRCYVYWKLMVKIGKLMVC